MASDTAILIAVAAAVVAAFALAWVGRRLWLRRVKRLLVMIFGRKEAVASAVGSLRELMVRLAEADSDGWVVFVGDAESDERRALGEIAHRMDVVALELGGTPLPKVLHELADDLEALARGVHDAATSVDDATGVDAILEAVGAIDLSGLSASLAEIETEIASLKAAFHVTDPAVYGGGLYI